MTSPIPAPIDPARIDANWRGIVIELDAPAPSRLERLLRLLNFPPSVARIMVATPSLRRAWYVAVSVVVLIGIAGADSAQPRSSLFTFLLLAPVVPALGVSMAYGVEADPAHEIGLATPRRGIFLVFTRAAAVLGFSVLTLGLVSLLVSDSTSLMALAWLIPSVALTTSTVAVMSYLSPRRSLGVVLTSWILVVIVVRVAATDPLAAFGVLPQTLMALAAAAAMAVAVARSESYDRLASR